MGEAYELARSHSKQLTAAVFDWRHGTSPASEDAGLVAALRNAVLSRERFAA
jgi:hypothetical protein